MNPGTRSPPKIRFPLRTKILLLFLVLSLVALGATGYLAFTQMEDVSTFAAGRSTDLGNKASADSAAALETNARASLLKLASDQAYISNIIFERVRADLGTMAYYAGEIQAHPDRVRTQRLYTQDDVPEDRFATTVLFYSPGAKETVTLEERNAAGMMGDIFIPVYANNRQISAVYVGTDSGISVIYPWTNGLNASFDPRLRSWFKDAKKNGGVTWSQPYVDLLGHGLMVTCSRPVYDNRTGRTWVVGADVTIDTINQNIIGTQVGDRGYAMLIDSTGHVITRPGLSAGDRRWDESFVTEDLLESNNTGLVRVAREMTAGKTGIERVQFEDGDRFIAYAPVPSVNWSVGVVMPVDDVTAPARLSQETIRADTRAAADHMASQQQTMKTIFIGIFIILILAVVVLTWTFSRFLTEPLQKLEKGAEEVGKGNLDYVVEVNTQDEFGSLAYSFNTMASDLREYISTLKRTTAEKERMLKELEIAKGIQQDFLPERAPMIPGFDLDGYNLPALEVGGDFYDFIPLDSDHTGLVIADVSGKGVPAALFMALSRTLIRASAHSAGDPVGSLREANVHLVEDSKTGMFVTLFYAVLDSRAKSLTYVNAGHNPPILISAGTGSVKLLSAKGIALGVINEIDLEAVKIPLNADDLIVLYTDGVTEATNEKIEEYGTDRFTDCVMKNRNGTAKEIREAVVRDVIAFAGTQPQHDDITIMVLKVL
ncbi:MULTISPECIES: SpoIIE family protein phosphatase [unclassified Methanoregula]|uniref:SpoIIE family protein phosphatase n=1 Tax=unclassified Methanoregula TaxID=2649730 RepID=UPI0009D4538A|nr:MULTISPECIES: SpoIIE family protein phosphatase [unclassified Methanoregula]OPX65303.1 MAG: osmolarity sensor protein [Methanoregula sp. PtaB.Bin085]OPY32212.1 MAG: osmolarity sensor protein [Methanoregula sp. PtaU1.Bin006]